MKKSIIAITILLIPIFIFTSQKGQENSDYNIEQLFDNYFHERLVIDPEFASEIGVTKSMGYNTDKLTELSERTIDSMYNINKKYLLELKRIDEKELSESQKINVDILKWYLEDEMEWYKYRFHTYIVNHMFGFHNQLISLMTEYHRIEDINDVKDYIKRLRKFKIKLSQIRKSIERQVLLGIIPPVFIIEKTKNAMIEFTSVKSNENVLYTSFVKKIKDIDIDITTREEFYCEINKVIENEIYPSYGNIISYLDTLETKTNDNAGVWKLPDGDKFYEYCLKHHTTTSFTPEEIHQIGLDEVKRIQKICRKLFTSIGIEHRDIFGEMESLYWEYVHSRKDFFYSKTDKGKREALNDYTNIIHDVTMNLSELFAQVPQETVLVKPVPDFKEKTMGTYYQPASFDGSRKGTFYVNLSYLPFKPGMKTLAYHEAIPGHHYQISLEKEFPSHRTFRRLFYFTAYTEGWALYSEKLGVEYGWYNDIHSELGYLNSELFRAVRLVIGTGIHYKKWSKERAYNYMKDNLGWGSNSEIDRYIVWPGQACAYKIGELEILRLRKTAKSKLRKKFDMKEFHNVILKNGSVPLSILEEQVNKYIKHKLEQ